MASIIDKLLRAGEGRLLRKLQSIAAEVNALEANFQALTDEELHNETAALRQRFAEGETLENAQRRGRARVGERPVRRLLAEPDAQVPATLDGESRDRRVEDRPAEHGGTPRQRARAAAGAAPD